MAFNQSRYRLAAPGAIYLRAEAVERGQRTAGGYLEHGAATQEAKAVRLIRFPILSCAVETPVSAQDKLSARGTAIRAVGLRTEAIKRRKSSLDADFVHRSASIGTAIVIGTRAVSST